MYNAEIILECMCQSFCTAKVILKKKDPMGLLTVVHQRAYGASRFFFFPSGRLIHKETQFPGGIQMFPTNEER